MHNVFLFSFSYYIQLNQKQMTVTDTISKQTTSRPTPAFRRLSLNDNFPKSKRQKLNRLNKRQKLRHSNKSHRNHRLKQFRTSVSDLLHKNKPKDTHENTNIHQQQQESLPCRPSIIKSSDLGRVSLKKSVTFAASSDSENNEHDKEETVRIY